MASRQVRLRSLAAVDIESAVAHYRSDAGDVIALEFVDALEQAIERIRRSPNIGSLRFAHEVGVPELRAWSVRRFPYLVFYVPSRDRTEVWRVLHHRRDIPASFVGAR